MANVRPGRREDESGLVVGAGELAELRQMLAAAGAPEEVLRALDSGGIPDEILNSLIGARLLPSPEESLANLLDRWKPLLRRGCDPFSAELCGAEFLGLLRETMPDEGGVPELLSELVAQVEQYAKPEALAMLRVLAVAGPLQVRSTAAEAADRLVSAGLKDQPWVNGLGAPKVDSCFGYADGFAQEAIAITFRYGRRSHALAVLIDHSLGGGVKDCWPTDRPDRVRAGYLNATRRYGIGFRDYEPAEACAILDLALSRQPCPVAPDQIEDVRDYLDLLRQRVALLSGLGGAPPAREGSAPKRRARAATGRTVHKVKVTLCGSKPPIWRRLEVPSGITLHQLHQSIQQAFGWQDYHMWVFETQYGDFGVADRELGHLSAASRKLDDVTPRAGDRIRYTYDFGDDWEHDIVVEDVLAAEPGVAYPRCVTGRRACPPEDCGGIWGYQELLEILADPGHEEHRDRLEWLGLRAAEEFNPAGFDLDAVNEALSGLAKVMVKR